MNPDQLYDIVDMQVDYWSKDYPQIRTMRNEIIEMLKVEKEKFAETLKRGEDMVKRIASELKGKNVGKLPENKLSELYDSHGIPPEIVKQVAENQGLPVEVPENFYNLVAKRHMQATKATEEEETAPEKKLDHAVEGLPDTEQLYYADASSKEFDAKVLNTTQAGFVGLDRPG